MRFVSFFGATLLLLLLSAPVFAQPYSSSNYKVEEYFFGSGGEVESTSSTYKSRGSAGALGVGSANSTSFQISAGNVTPYEEFIEVIVPSVSVNLGTLSTSTTGTGSATFSVRAYLSSGYVVQTIGASPTNESGFSLNALTSATASTVNTEQFGINLVANTAPATFGANPAPYPDGTFANGVAAAGYNTPNNYKYVNGNTIASAPKGEGRTDFTISYIANISSITRAGLYLMTQGIVSTATF